jgi:hypothetical protein
MGLQAGVVWPFIIRRKDELWKNPCALTKIRHTRHRPEEVHDFILFFKIKKFFD